MVQRFVWNGDKTLKNDLNKERQDITDMYEILNKNNNIKLWIHGHFHTHEEAMVEDTKFICLNCDEFYNVIQNIGK